MDITMPQLGETVTEGTITRWLKKVGERVEVDEPLFEVSTDKVDSEVPAPGSGYLAEILVPEGDTVDVGVRLAVLSEAPGASAGAPTTSSSEGQALPTAPMAPSGSPAPASASAGSPTGTAPPRPVVAPPPAAVEPAGAPVAPAVSGSSASSDRVGGEEGGNGDGLVTSPLVRRLAAERGVDLHAVRGSGDGGRITRNDVLAAPTSQPSAAASPTRAMPTAAEAQPAPAQRAVGAADPSGPVRGDEAIPFDNIRRRTAEHMVRSKATSAHVYTSVEVDFERVDRVRRGYRDEWKAREGFSLTYLPFVARAFCDAVDDYPNVNASVDGDSLVVHHDVNLGIAVDLDHGGLLAPVIKQADGKRLRLIAREIHDLAAKARSKGLMPDDVIGGTFTITNMGPFGTLMTLPIINQPQVAILATDGVRKRPVVVEGPEGDDAIAIHPVGVVVLAWDHRAFDGAYAAGFLRAMRETIEEREWEAELA